MKRLILFDIDGTLLSTRGAAKRAFRRAMIEVYGETGPIEGHAFDGKTDPQIVRELLELARYEAAEIDAGFSALWTAYLRELATELAHPAHETVVLPGVTALLDALAAVSELALVGLLTGNIEGGARLKLESARLGPFRFGAYGSDHERRDRLPAVAVQRARDLVGIEFRGRDIIIIGDTPSDVRCGRALDACAVAVATGSHDPEALRTAGAHRVFANLEDTAGVLEAILG